MRLKLPQLDLSLWLVIAAAGVVLFIALGLARPTLLGLQFDPFGMDARKIDRLTTERDTAQSNAAARTLEVQGEREQAQRVETFHTQVVELRDFTARAEAQARSAPDAQDPLPADRAARLHAADRVLCLSRPRSCPAAPPLDPGSG